MVSTTGPAPQSPPTLGNVNERPHLGRVSAAASRNQGLGPWRRDRGDGRGGEFCHGNRSDRRSIDGADVTKP